MNINEAIAEANSHPKSQSLQSIAGRVLAAEVLDAVERTARRCAEISHNWRDEKTGISCCHRFDIEAKIRSEFGLFD
jgi:hypothetical protein